MDDPLEKANQRIGELRREITAKLKQVKDVEQRNLQLQQAVEQHEKAIRQLNEQRSNDDKRRQESEEEKWAEYNAMMAKVREEGKALDEQRIKLDAQRAKQQKEIADNRALVDQWEATVDNVRRESDAIKQTNIQQLQQYQQQYIALQEQTAQLKRSFNERLHALDQQLTSTQDESRAKDEVLERQALSIKHLEADIITLREEKEQQWRTYRDRTEESNRKHEEKTQQMTEQYLALCRESESIISEVKREVEWRGDKMSVLQQWELTRERVEDESSTLKSNYQKLIKQQESDKKERARIDRETEKEMKALRDSIITLQSDKDLLTKELNTKKAALKVYKDEFEAKQKARIETEEKERAKAAAEKAAGSRGGLGSAISSLFGGKKREDEATNGVQQQRTPHPSAIGSGADKGFLDLEEEMAVALTERVERLSEEKGKLEDDMIVLQRQLEQEKIVAAQLRQQLKLEGKEIAGSRSIDDRKKDKLVLSPENTAKVLSETIARNRELEEVKKEQEKEIKRLKAQVEVKKQELKEAERKRGNSVAGLGGTPVKSRSNSTLSSTQAGMTQTGAGARVLTRGPSNGDLTATGGTGAGGSGGGAPKER